VLDWLQQLLGGGAPGGSEQPSRQAVQQNPQTGAFEPYAPPPAPSALDMLANLTGATDMQQAYQAAGRGEYLPALGQGAWGAGQAASMAVPALRSGMAAVRAGAPVAREMAGVLPALMRDEFGGIKLYHGSPYDFPPEPGAPLGRFRDDKIGTGEGVQAYAYGHYGAEAEPVARGYRDTLAGPPRTSGVRIDGMPAEDMGLSRSAISLANMDLSGFQSLDALRASYEASLQRAQEVLQRTPNSAVGIANRDMAQRSLDALDELKGRKLTFQQPEQPGHMYELDINAEPEHFLDWDKPATAQPPNVQNALTKIWEKLGGTTEGRQYPPFAAHSEATGESLHAALATALGSKEAAAAALRDAGVPGVRYLDQGSRRFPAMYQADLAKAQAEVADLSGALKTAQDALQNVDPGSRAHNSLSLDALNHSSNLETAQARLDRLLQNPVEATSNYVTFDPALITILRKYGLMGPVAGAGLLGAAEQQ
jgi:hypothetical protein